jgi:hypothetical protein
MYSLAALARQRSAEANLETVKLDGLRNEIDRAKSATESTINGIDPCRAYDDGGICFRFQPDHQEQSVDVGQH